MPREKPRAEPLRIVYLNSEGGQIREGVAMARMIRKAGLDTAVRARTEVCESACTMLFAAGIHRYNIGGNGIYEGTTGLTGLGYHPAWQRGNRVRWTERSTKGLDQMAALYREMGQPRAAELCRRAAINTLWRPSGRTSLELKIATSLAAPPASRTLARSSAGIGAQGTRGSADEAVGDR